ncbi:DNA polymerase III subunit beta [Candidatus Saccharibacteria bacterium]|nr:DNA polymerase III subunit beta [Candidatus Saccharibacteria bacterium]
MKLQVTQENLHRALSNVAKVASSRGTLPILANVLIKTVGNRVSIAATNLDIAITQYIGSKVTTEGSVTVPARLMQDFVASLPSDTTITLELDETKLKVTTDHHHSVVNGTSAEDYPVMPAIESGVSWSLPAQSLKASLQQVLFAASNDEARPVLTAVYIHTHEGAIYFAATDSYRLAEKKVAKQSQEISLLVPASALQDLLRVLGDSDDAVSITHDDQQILFKVNDTELVARLIEGTYPEYRKLIPQDFSHTATLAKKELHDITKVSALFARENAGSVAIQLNETTQEISIQATASQLGENTASAPADITSEGNITLNSRYILDGLAALTGDKVSVNFNEKLEPCVLKSPTDSDYTHVIMPLKS